MSPPIRNIVGLAGIVASLLGAASAADAGSIRLINQCDRVCASNPRAVCYRSCLSGGGLNQSRALDPNDLKPTRPKPPQNGAQEPPNTTPVFPESRKTARNAASKDKSGSDWSSVVFASPSRSGPSGAGGGGGGGGKAK